MRVIPSIEANTDLLSRNSYFASGAVERYLTAQKLVNPPKVSCSWKVCCLWSCGAHVLMGVQLSQVFYARSLGITWVDCQQAVRGIMVRVGYADHRHPGRSTAKQGSICLSTNKVLINIKNKLTW